LPKSLKTNIKRIVPNVKDKVSGTINANWWQTRAFGVRYVPGIYINDQERFGGPVKTHPERNLIVEEIIQAFNKDDNVKKHGLSAREYRALYKAATYEALLPDIWIDHPDTVFFEQHGPFIQPNVDYGPIKGLEDVERDMLTGIKGRYPLLCVSSDLANLASDDDARDLTLAYKLIIRGMET